MKAVRFTILTAIISIALATVAACAPAAAPTPVPPTAAPAAAATTAPAPTAAPTAAAAPAGKSAVVAVAKNAKYGNIVTDGNGMTLYMYPNDTRNPSVSNCYEQFDCIKQWPPLVTETGNIEVKGGGIDQKLLGTTVRKDGAKQVTLNGWPLYYWARDKNPGNILGQGVNDIWWVMGLDGSIFTDPTTVVVNVTLGPGRDGDQNGTARLTARGDKTEVSLNIKPGAVGAPQPVHIHEGACPAPGAVKFPLTNVVDGRSTTTLDVKLADLLTGGFSINAHKSATEVGSYVACGGIPQGTVVGLDKGRDDDQHGTAVLIAQGAKTQVNVFIKPLPGVSQPMHIHDGACPAPGAVKFPLTNLKEGKSSTVVEASLADLLKGGLAINAHRSAEEAGKYVACANLTAAAK